MASTIYHLTQIQDGLNVAVGHPAPDFQLQTDTGEYWRLSRNRGKVIALLFYPKDETIVCTEQMCSLRDNWVSYQETGAMIVGISPGTIEEHRSFRRNHELPIPLLADHKRRVTNVYCQNGFYPTYFTRGIVIIDQEGIVRRQEIMLRDLRPSDSSLIASIKAVQAEGETARRLLPPTDEHMLIERYA